MIDGFTVDDFTVDEAKTNKFVRTVVANIPFSEIKPLGFYNSGDASEEKAPDCTLVRCPMDDRFIIVTRDTRASFQLRAIAGEVIRSVFGSENACDYGAERTDKKKMDDKWVYINSTATKEGFGKGADLAREYLSELISIENVLSEACRNLGMERMDTINNIAQAMVDSRSNKDLRLCVDTKNGQVHVDKEQVCLDAVCNAKSMEEQEQIRKAAAQKKGIFIVYGDEGWTIDKKMGRIMEDVEDFFYETDGWDGRVDPPLICDAVCDGVHKRNVIEDSFSAMVEKYKKLESMYRDLAELAESKGIVIGYTDAISSELGSENDPWNPSFMKCVDNIKDALEETTDDLSALAAFRSWKLYPEGSFTVHNEDRVMDMWEAREYENSSGMDDFSSQEAEDADIDDSFDDCEL